MSLAAGTVAITGGWDGAGSPTAHRTGSGCALAVFDAIVAAKAAQSMPPDAPTLGQSDGGYLPARVANTTDIANANKARLAYFKELASTAIAIAAVIPYIVANAVVSPGTLAAHVTSQSLGITPNPNNAATPIVAPASPVDIPLTGGGTIS